MKVREILLIIGYMIGAVIIGGCMDESMSAGEKTASFIRGDLVKVIDADINEVYEAVNETTEEMGLSPVSSTKDELTAEIVCLDSEDTTIKILLEAKPDDTTLTRIRIGLLGDENKSLVIYRKIDQKVTN